MTNIFTIGYSAFGIDEFIDELQKNSIVCVVDVRSNPVSGEYYKDYNGYNLEKILKQHDIHYRSYAHEFGARQDDPHFSQTKVMWILKNSLNLNSLKMV